MGIVGTGAIGTMTARLFQAFGAKVIAYSRTVRPEVEEMGISYVSLETLMAQSDIVSLHLPSNPQTKGMISRAMLQKMKPTAILINVARGAVVDNTALAEALNQAKIAGAGIDVFDMEPPLPDTYPLLRAKHTVLTPHVAFATEERMLRRAEIVCRNVEAYQMCIRDSDCGVLLFDPTTQDVHAGGSGCGCSAVVLTGHLLREMRRGTYRNLLFCGTGALHSPTATMQGESIPGICHAVAITTEKGGAS